MDAIRILEDEHGILMNLTIFGSGSSEDSLHEYAQKLGINVEFKGVVENPRLILSEKEICFAGGYLSILEGNACGTPVIAIAQSNLKHQYYRAMRLDGGVVSIQTTPRGIAKEITRLRKDINHFQYVSTTGHSSASEFSWESLTKAYLDLWEIS
jgi:glycosyltransferase involved in cell wall biosynthesis